MRAAAETVQPTFLLSLNNKGSSCVCVCLLLSAAQWGESELRDCLELPMIWNMGSVGIGLLLGGLGESSELRN